MVNRIWDTRSEALQASLKLLRIDAEMSQMEIAEILGKPQSYVSKYENGERRLDFIEVLDVCSALNIEVATLIKVYESNLNQ